jgi:membrane associated rhomboid family serine protease
MEIVPPSERKALEWITALAAAGLQYRLVLQGPRWRLTVPEEQYDQALEAIRAYEEANVGWPPQPSVATEAPALAHPFKSGLWGSGFILMVFICFGPYDAQVPWLRAAAADSLAIQAGEWWRPITALTLHAGFAHLAGNMLFLTLLGGTLCRAIGVGSAWALILLSGIAGNTLTAWGANTPHVAVGASTASFGALGLLAVYQAIDTYRRTGHWRSVWGRVWIPVCGALAMLGFLGTAPGSDLAAHGLGFLAGAVLALPAQAGGHVHRSEPWQAALKVATLLLLLLAWRAAIHAVT